MAPSKRKLWLDSIGDHVLSVQRARLDQELHSGSGSSISEEDNDIDIDNADDINMHLDGLEQELGLVLLDLEAELLELELTDLDEDLDHVESPGSDIGRSPSPTSSDIADEAHERWSARLNELITFITSTRVLEPEPPNPKSSQLPLLDHWKDHNLRNFRAKLRVHPVTFKHLLELIKDHTVFQNNSNSPQLPPEVQFAIYLARAGHYGNGSSVVDVATWAGVSVGLVRKATIRVMIALVSLHDQAIHLPTSEEKEASKAWVEEACCPEWRGGFITVDGTKFTFFQRPGLHGDAWFDKNKDYSADCQVVNLLHNLLIIDYSIGHTGSVHDAWAFRSTHTFKEHDTIFADGEWVWADTAYPCETWSACPFKKPVGRDLTPDQRTYNYHVSKVRIRSEHAIGLLKGTFQSLKEIRLQIKDKKKHLEMILWIRCCIILHNLIIRIEEGTEIDETWREALIREGMAGEERNQGHQDEDEALMDEHRDEQAGQIFRRELMNKLFDSPFSRAYRR